MPLFLSPFPKLINHETLLRSPSLPSTPGFIPRTLPRTRSSALPGQPSCPGEKAEGGAGGSWGRGEGGGAPGEQQLQTESPWLSGSPGIPSGLPGAHPGERRCRQGSLLCQDPRARCGWGGQESAPCLGVQQVTSANKVWGTGQRRCGSVPVSGSQQNENFNKHPTPPSYIAVS